VFLLPIKQASLSYTVSPKRFTLLLLFPFSSFFILLRGGYGVTPGVQVPVMETNAVLSEASGHFGAQL
jgi:hypothetical protein